MIYSDPVTTTKGSSAVPVDLGSSPSGFYTLILRNNNDQVIRKILVKK